MKAHDTYKIEIQNIIKGGLGQRNIMFKWNKNERGFLLRDNMAPSWRALSSKKREEKKLLIKKVKVMLKNGNTIILWYKSKCCVYWRNYKIYIESPELDFVMVNRRF